MWNTTIIFMNVWNTKSLQDDQLLFVLRGIYDFFRLMDDMPVALSLNEEYDHQTYQDTMEFFRKKDNLFYLIIFFDFKHDEEAYPAQSTSHIMPKLGSL